MAGLIRLTAKVLLVICLLAAVVFLCVFEIGIGLSVATASAVAGWLTFILLMGFSEMIDNTAVQAQYSREMLAMFRRGHREPAEMRNPSDDRQERKVTDSACDDEEIACPACGMMQKKNRSVCWKCGVKLAKAEEE